MNYEPILEAYAAVKKSGGPVKLGRIAVTLKSMNIHFDMSHRGWIEPIEKSGFFTIDMSDKKAPIVHLKEGVELPKPKIPSLEEAMERIIHVQFVVKKREWIDPGSIYKMITGMIPGFSYKQTGAKNLINFFEENGWLIEVVKYKEKKLFNRTRPKSLPFVPYDRSKEEKQKYRENHGVERLENFDMKDIISDIRQALKNGEKSKNYLGHNVNLVSKRLMMFAQKGTVCTCCGLKATHFGLDLPAKQQVPHFNLYGITDKGKEILFTKDHHVPKSKGGSDHLDNLNTMCGPCNWNKSDTDPEVWKEVKNPVSS